MLSLKNDVVIRHLNVVIKKVVWRGVFCCAFDREFHDDMQEATVHLYSGDNEQADTSSAGKNPHNSSLNL